MQDTVPTSASSELTGALAVSTGCADREVVPPWAQALEEGGTFMVMSAQLNCVTNQTEGLENEREGVEHSDALPRIKRRRNLSC
jgi:hypothetical protein